MNKNLANEVNQNIEKYINSESNMNSIAEDLKQHGINLPNMYNDTDDDIEQKSEQKIKSAGKKIFTGFQRNNKTTLSKYSVYLPISKISVNVTPLLFREELLMAQSILEKKEMYMEILKTIYKHIEEGPNEINTLDAFINNVAEADVETLLYGIFLVSYGHEFNLGENEIKCVNCGENYPGKTIKLPEIYEENSLDDSFGPFDVIKREFEIKLDEYGYDNVSFFIKFPTIKDSIEKGILSTINNKNMDEISWKEALSVSIASYVSRFIYENEEYSDKESIMNAIETLNVKAKKAIKNEIKEKILKYGSRLVIKWKCAGKNLLEKCNTDNQIRYSMLNLFFREISESLS